MKKAITPLLLLLSVSCLATIWKVGPGRIYSKPSDVASLVTHGDTVEIDMAVYAGDVCSWNSNNLLLKGIGGRPHLRANGQYALGKGTWVLAGNNIRVENIEFSEASVPDQNGAGIRLDGIGVSIKNCYFHHNENGILTGNNGGTILIENSEFGYNGFGDGFSHNIYIGHVDTAFIRYSYFHHANVGHEIKSRARVNYILYNRVSNEATGNASREIDLPNGGVAIILGNIIQQGANSQNGNMVGYGLEGLSNNPPHELYFVHNTAVNERSAGSFISAHASTAFLKIYSNIFTGPGTQLIYSGSSIPDNAGNFTATDIGAIQFINAAAYDYHISGTSPSVNSGANAGAALNGFSLQPAFEYIHPCSFSARTQTGNPDAGSYEAAAVVPLQIKNFSATAINSRVILSWNTEQENNVLEYEILRKTGGNGFQKIAAATAKNSSSNFYSFTDSCHYQQIQYRLKAIYTTGKIIYSDIIFIKQQLQKNISITKTGEKIFFYNLPEHLSGKQGTVSIFNLGGQLVFKEDKKLQEGMSIRLPAALGSQKVIWIAVLQSSGEKIILEVQGF